MDMRRHNSLSLLINGAEAFPEIMRCLENAEKSIEIHMFIWRADNIGMEMAEAVLRAADRGVQIDITVDRYAVLLEKSEESAVSFFHEPPTASEWIRILLLRGIYRLPVCALGLQQRHDHLLDRMLQHKNIRIHRDRILADHSKYYVIDDSVLILGGMNIEDKENGCDLSGRAYWDYMVKVSGSDAIAAFRTKMRCGIDADSSCRFMINSRAFSPKRFELYGEYLEIVRNARQELWIVMAYFSPTKELCEAILSAAERGVRVKILLSASANFQNEANRYAAKQLLRRSKGGISVFLSPRMIHAKLVCSESRISLGSCNMTRRAFRQLCELNISVETEAADFCSRLMQNLIGECALAERAKSAAEIRCRSLFGWLEGLGC